MTQINPDREVKHGLHVDKFWPGLIHSVWSFGLLEIRRERIYKERLRLNLKLEGWLVIFRLGRHRVGFKWERDIATDS